MRKLASIQKIKSLEPIEGADTIEKATVLGWQVVVKKGEFNVNDMVVYCEIDSIMPDKPEFEFLKPRGMRIRTVKLRGQISQGICFPLTILPAYLLGIENSDCTEVLGITKYEPTIPACLSGIAKGDFPSFIPKTDETRVQVLQELLDKYKGEQCYITEKLDGSSATYYIKDNQFGVCSRNLELIENPENSFWKVARQLDIENKLRSLNKNIAIQGELIGEGIQSNKYKLKGQTVAFFNAFNIDKQEYLNFFDFHKLINNLELSVVPIIALDYTLENDIEAIVERSAIKSTLTDTLAEGIVIRPYIEKYSILNNRVSFKAINPEFLLKHKE